MRPITSLAVLALAGCAAHAAPPETLAITNAAVVDVADGSVDPGRTILISGGRITAVGPAASTRVPPGAQVADARGRFVIPGLWDAHSHAVMYGPSSRSLYLAHGVTSVRDMGAERFEVAKAWRDSIAAGQMLGPRMRIAGPVVENARWLAAVRRMNDAAGTPWMLHERFGPASVAEVDRWVDSVAALGADHIKVRNWPAPELGRALVERARQRGLPVFGHGNEPFPRSGVTTLEHSVWPPLRGSAESRDSVWRTLAASGTAMVPTLVTWPIRLQSPDTAIARIERGGVAGMEYVPAKTRARWRDQFLQLKQETPMDWTEIVAGEMRNVGEMHRAGVELLAGSDIGAPLLVPGLSLHDELELLVSRAGLTPLQALRAATLGPARVVGMERELGTVHPGKLADLVILDANPLLDIRATRRIHAVVARGQLLDRARLDGLLEGARAAAR